MDLVHGSVVGGLQHLCEKEGTLKYIKRFSPYTVRGPGGGQGGVLLPPNFWNGDTSDFSTNTQSRFASVVLDGSLGPDGVLGCMSSAGNNARGKSRALAGCCVGSKSTFRVLDGDEGVAGRKVQN